MVVGEILAQMEEYKYLKYKEQKNVKFTKEEQRKNYYRQKYMRNPIWRNLKSIKEDRLHVFRAKIVIHHPAIACLNHEAGNRRTVARGKQEKNGDVSN